MRQQQKFRTMNNLNRRRFLKTSLAGAALATVGKPALAAGATWGSDENEHHAHNQSHSKATELKLSFQEGTAPGETLREKLDY